MLTRLQPRYSWILLKVALNTINHQISRNWKKIIIKFFVQVLSVALTITSIVLSVIRGIIPIIFFYFRIKLGICKRSDICQLWLSMTSVWRILWVSNSLGIHSRTIVVHHQYISCKMTTINLSEVSFIKKNAITSSFILIHMYN